MAVVEDHDLIITTPASRLNPGAPAVSCDVPGLDGAPASPPSAHPVGNGRAAGHSRSKCRRRTRPATALGVAALWQSLPAPSRAMLGPPEPSPRRAFRLSKIAPSSLQRAASCSSACCAWTRESGAAARDATAACGRTASSESPTGGGRRRDTIRAGRCEVVLRKHPVIG